MKFRLKKKYIILAASSFVLVLVFYTLAFFMSTDHVTNSFTGENEETQDKRVMISVTENFDPPPEKNDEPFQKSVCISNTGEEDCYIRVRLEFSSSQIRDISWFSNDDDKDNDSAYINAADYPESVLPEGWVYREADGFYYYTKAVPAGQATASLIKWVKTVFPDDDTVNADEYDIFVYSEAVSANGESGGRMTYEEAWR
ncbi:hypothetical protein [Ruminococcus sp.]|uniref:hypothetical protein n=1 Tax=Ruminococcus sp. TaxID=41978 RepID=UPI0025E89D3E|nr:hypothetical protein [Ruminococcus sp.]MBQ8965429.1 hypothetical protein [Ruminococcus sp.]